MGSNRQDPAPTARRAPTRRPPPVSAVFSPNPGPSDLAPLRISEERVSPWPRPVPAAGRSPKSRDPPHRGSGEQAPQPCAGNAHDHLRASLATILLAADGYRTCWIVTGRVRDDACPRGYIRPGGARSLSANPEAASRRFAIWHSRLSTSRESALSPTAGRPAPSGEGVARPLLGTSAFLLKPTLHGRAQRRRTSGETILATRIGEPQESVGACGAGLRFHAARSRDRLAARSSPGEYPSI